MFVGRFQPFHIGHLKAIRHILDRTLETIIVIGSAQYSHTTNNPFTAGERITMIRLALDEAKIDPSKYYLIPVSDVNMHKIWVAHVISHVPHFELVFSNEPLTSRLFKEEGFLVEQIPLFNRKEYASTEIRRRLLLDQDWVSLVPKSVADFIKEISGVERVKELSQNDK